MADVLDELQHVGADLVREDCDGLAPALMVDGEDVYLRDHILLDASSYGNVIRTHLAGIVLESPDVDPVKNQITAPSFDFEPGCFVSLDSTSMIDQSRSNYTASPFVLTFKSYLRKYSRKSFRFDVQ